MLEYIVLGQIPGTNYYLDFNTYLVMVSGFLLGALIIKTLAPLNINADKKKIQQILNISL